MTKHRTSRARPLRALAALAAALGILAVSLVVAAPPASADGPHCKHDRFSNACLSFDWYTFDWGNAHVGIDWYTSERNAREILACPGGPDFRASLWGDDGARGPSPSDDHIRDLELQPGWPIADSTGIAAELIARDIHTSELDEDDGDDQIYARVSFADCNAGERHEFATGYLQVLQY